MSANELPHKRIVIAHHLMWTLYGWWLPNDPRGSTSRVIRSDFVAGLGELHVGRKRIQPTSREIRAFHQQSAAALKHPLLKFLPADFPTVADAIGCGIAEYDYTCTC